MSRSELDGIETRVLKRQLDIMEENRRNGNTINVK